jgi:hypothetical protein
MDIDDLESEVLDPLQQAVHGGLIGILASEGRRVASRRDVHVWEGSTHGRPSNAANGYHQTCGAPVSGFVHPLIRPANRVN